MPTTKPTKPTRFPAIFLASHRHHYARACLIQRTLGTRAAAGYLRNLGYRIEYALAILATTGHLNHAA